MKQLTEMLGIKYPILQGAMAWVATPELVSAVSNAGGLGVLGTAREDIEAIRGKIRRTKELTPKPFGVNLFLMSSQIEDVVQLIIEENIPVVTTGAGSPGPYIPILKKAGAKVIPVVASVSLARRVERQGADAVICEGMEAGGHIGKITTMSLVPQVVDAVNIPVIAAGGIADGRGMAAVFALGAVGVQMGTRFAVAKESIAHDHFKQAVIEARDLDSVITGEITGHPVRVLRNQLTQEMLEIEEKIRKMDEPNIFAFEEAGKGALRRAIIEGDVEKGSVMAGQIAGLVKEIKSCDEIIQEIMAKFNEIIK